jgi:hypothetical protein
MLELHRARAARSAFPANIVLYTRRVHRASPFGGGGAGGSQTRRSRLNRHLLSIHSCVCVCVWRGISGCYALAPRDRGQATGTCRTRLRECTRLFFFCLFPATDVW